MQHQENDLNKWSKNKRTAYKVFIITQLKMPRFGWQLFCYFMHWSDEEKIKTRSFHSIEFKYSIDKYNNNNETRNLQFGYQINQRKKNNSPVIKIAGTCQLFHFHLFCIDFRFSCRTTLFFFFHSVFVTQNLLYLLFLLFLK